MNVPLKLDSKLVVIGTFQTGKTTWLRWYLSNFKKFWVYAPRYSDWVKPISDIKTTTNFQEAYQNYLTTGKGIYTPTGSDTNFVEWCQKASKMDNTVLMLDEASQVLSNYQQSNEAEWMKLTRNCHARNNGLILATHRLQDMAVINRNVHGFVFFRVVPRQDWEAIAGVSTPEIAEAARILEQYHYVFFQIVPPYAQGICPPVKVN